MQNLKQKIQETMPKEVQQYLTSMKATDLNLHVCNKYGIKGDEISKYVDLVNRLFFKEIRLGQVFMEIKKLFGFGRDKAQQMARDLVGIRLLPVKDWYDENVEEYIKNLGGDPADYEEYVKEQKEALPKEEEYFKEQLTPEKEEDVEETENEEEKQEETAKEEETEEIEFDAEKEKNESLDIFKKGLVNLLVNSGFYLEDYNDVLLLLVTRDDGFKKGLENALFQNYEKLTHKKFLLEGEPKEPNVANWLKHFLKQEGSGMFDNITLSRFLSTSENVKVLDEEEKQLVQKLLLLYRNIKFFPDSMPGKDVDQWEIIPLGDKDLEEEQEPRGAQEEQAQEKRGVQEKKSELTQEAKKRDKKIKELERIANSYPEGSLEKTAALEEIKRLKQE